MHLVTLSRRVPGPVAHCAPLTDLLLATQTFAALREPVSDKLKLKTAGDFNIKPDEAGQLIEATRHVISQSIYHHPKPPAVRGTLPRI